MRFSGFFAVSLGITCLALEASAFVSSRASSSTLTAGSSAASSMSPVDLNELSLSSSGNDAVVDIRGGDLSTPSPSAVPKKSPQMLLVGIYFFLWGPSSTLTAGSSAVSSMYPVDKKKLPLSSSGDNAVVPCWGGDHFPPCPPSVPKKSARTFLVGIYFFLWYTLNIAYNITNKIALNMISLPWTVSEAQLVVGSIFVLSLWLFRLRQAPGLTVENIEGLTLVAFCHVFSHVFAVIGLGAGAMTIVPVVKATEPIFTALLSAAFFGQRFSPLVYLTLIPVVSGVALAHVKELDFNWAALGGAMGSNLAVSTRLILSKRKMGMDMGKNMTPANLYAVSTIMAASILLPLTGLFEGPKIQSVWEATVDSSEKKNEIVFNTAASGVFFYLYNEVAFRCLGVVHPLTHSVGNTFKRVLIITISMIIFKTRHTSLAAVGSIMTTLGVFLYSLAREWTSKA